MKSPIEIIVVSNTIPQHEKIAICPKIQVLVIIYIVILYTVYCEYYNALSLRQKMCTC